MSLDAKKKEKDSINLLGGRSVDLGFNGSRSLSFLLPLRFFKELEKFTRNNTLTTAISDKGRIEAQFCQRCLKAHAIKTALEMNLDRDTIHSLSKALPGAIGHNGYYMNQNTLIPIKSR